MQSIAIYLAGSIQKGHEKGNELWWSETHMEQMRQRLREYDLLFLNPAFRTDDLSDSRSIFGRDMLQIFSSDVVFVDARDRRGLGVGAEMMWAKVNRISIVIWAPKETHYHLTKAELLGTPLTNYVHPFVASLADQIVETVEEGAEWIGHFVKNPSFSVNGAEAIREAMEYYKATQLDHDVPIQEMLEQCSRLRERVEESLI